MKNNHGFSLLEVIISTAVIALLSEFILQMFLVSIYLNQKAYNLDMGVNAAIQAMEILKDEEMPESGVILTQYYDSKWREIATGQTEPDGLPGNVKYILNLNAAKDRSNNSEVFTSFDLTGKYITRPVKSGLFRIDAAVYTVKADGEQEEICSLNTYKYNNS